MSMDRFALRLTLALAICISSAAPAYSQTRHVVVLYDERTELPGLSLLDASLVRTLTAGSQDPVAVYREAMDLSRFRSDGYLLLLRDHLRAKYADRKIDVAVAVMGPALDFLLRHGDAIFPGTPIVFCGIDRRELGSRTLPPHVTGVLLKREFSPTLELALRLHPDTERVVFVAGTSEFDARLVEQAREELRAYEHRVEFRYLTELPFADLLAELSTLPPKTVVLYSTLFQDGADKPFVPHEASELISEAANAPVYGFVDQYAGHGIVGGRLYTLEQHGEEAAELALEILAGSQPAELAFEEAGNGVTMFDWRQLQRWKISEARLPADAVVRFREESLWDQYAAYLLGGVALVALQALMIGVLLLQRSRRRRMASELRESELRFRTMADTAPVMIWLVGIDGLFTFLNKVWLDFTGDSLQQQLGETWTGHVHPEDLQRCLELYEQRLGSRQEFTVECRLRRHDDTYRWMLCTGVPRFSLDGAFLGYIGSCIDISARREAALEVQRNNMELAHLNRVATVGELTASIAHELNQPLSAILSNAQVAKMILAAERPALNEIEDILEDIVNDDRRAAEIIRHMRSLLRKHEVVRKPIEINAILREVLHLVSAEAAARKVAIRFEPAENLAQILGDRVHLQQVMMNLALNGLEAMVTVPDDQRSLTVRTQNADNKAVRIAVSDSGAGIPADISEKLFEPFCTTKKRGLGMGLSITRTIVEAHEGRVWAENNADAGATFHLEFPAFKERSTSRSKPITHAVDEQPPSGQHAVQNE